MEREYELLRGSFRMIKKSCFISSNIGKKYLVAITGICLSLFVLAHMLGNLLILVSPRAYNLYGHALVTSPLLYPAEIGLVLCFFFHIGLAIKLTLSNRMTRSSRYAVPAAGSKATGLISRTMWAQGLLILAFMILHLITFKYGNVYEVEYGGVVARDLHRLVVEVFRQPGYVAWYIVCLLALGLHLAHGVSSSLQTLGIHHPRYQCLMKKMGIVYGVVVMSGFLSQPLYVFFIYRG